MQPSLEAAQSDPTQPARRDEHRGDGATRSTGRMEAFADAVFAIAFTLPVVEISAPAVSSAEFGRALLYLWPSYLGYALASFVIGLYWVHHHFSGAIYRTTGHWFLVATVLFLAMIGFIAFPARVFAEHMLDGTAGPAGARYWVVSLAILAWTWLLKWTVGRRRGQVDPRLEPDYVSRLNRRYWAFTLAMTLAAALGLFSWQLGLALSTLALATLLLPPETPKYTSEAPVVEGES